MRRGKRPSFLQGLGQQVPEQLSMREGPATNQSTSNEGRMQEIGFELLSPLKSARTMGLDS